VDIKEAWEKGTPLNVLAIECGVTCQALLRKLKGLGCRTDRELLEERVQLDYANNIPGPKIAERHGIPVKTVKRILEIRETKQRRS
jgi:hypothetical protein